MKRLEAVMTGRQPVQTVIAYTADNPEALELGDEVGTIQFLRQTTGVFWYYHFQTQNPDILLREAAEQEQAAFQTRGLSPEAGWKTIQAWELEYRDWHGFLESRRGKQARNWVFNHDYLKIPAQLWLRDNVHKKQQDPNSAFKRDFKMADFNRWFNYTHLPKIPPALLYGIKTPVDERITTISTKRLVGVKWVADERELELRQYIYMGRVVI
jgi:hypothetical protein